jgi:hypothetical protein
MPGRLHAIERPTARRHHEICVAGHHSSAGGLQPQPSRDQKRAAPRSQRRKGRKAVGWSVLPAEDGRPPHTCGASNPATAAVVGVKEHRVTGVTRTSSCDPGRDQIIPTYRIPTLPLSGATCARRHVLPRPRPLGRPHSRPTCPRPALSSSVPASVLQRVESRLKQTTAQATSTNANHRTESRSHRTPSRRQQLNQDSDRSTFHRCRPSRVDDSTPRRAIRGPIPRRRR